MFQPLLWLVCQKNMVKKITTLHVLLVLLTSSVFAQEELDSLKQTQQQVILEFGAFGAKDGALPFWMKHNNSQRFTDLNANATYADVLYSGSHNAWGLLDVFWETEAVSTFAPEGIYGSIIQANAGIATGFIKLRVGMDEEFFGVNDTTLTVGNLSYGNNARPLPKIVLATNGWQRSPIFGNALSFQAYLAHGWFEKDRYQSRALLHQKYFYLKGELLNKRLSLIAGLNHNAQWGGRNLDSETAQPNGFKNYARIFFSLEGGDDALDTDKHNALGNHLGNYDLRAEYNFGLFTVANYWQFLWEDSSGLTPLNWRDGLVGIRVRLNKSNWVDRLVVEHVNTTHQDAHKTRKDGTSYIEPDHFMNNSVYRSGWSYNNDLIGSPMFLILNEESRSGSRVKNMIDGLHVGLGGSAGMFDYQMRYTKFTNAGVFRTRIEPKLSVNAVDLRVLCKFSKSTQLSARFNYQDANFDSGKNFGVQLGFIKNFNLN